MRLKRVGYGIANYFPKEGVIEYNKDLNPQLLFRLLNHERGHKRDGLMDFWHDLKFLFDFRTQWLMFKFMMTNLSSWVQLSPIFIRKKGVAIDFFALTLLALGLVMLI